MERRQLVLLIPDELKQRAYFSSGGEAAWSSEDAQAIIDLASESSIGILGLEVWLPTVPGPTIPAPFIYTLSIAPFANESRQHFVERSIQAAREYVKTFVWDAADQSHHGHVPYFNFTFDE